MVTIPTGTYLFISLVQAGLPAEAWGRGLAEAGPGSNTGYSPHHKVSEGGQRTLVSGGHRNKSEVMKHKGGYIWKSTRIVALGHLPGTEILCNLSVVIPRANEDVGFKPVLWIRNDIFRIRLRHSRLIRNLDPVSDHLTWIFKVFSINFTFLFLCVLKKCKFF